MFCSWGLMLHASAMCKSIMSMHTKTPWHRSFWSKALHQLAPEVSSLIQLGFSFVPPVVTNLHQKPSIDMGVSNNRGGPPKSSILIGFSIINHPFWGTPIFGNTHIEQKIKWIPFPTDQSQAWRNSPGAKSCMKVSLVDTCADESP